MTFDRERSTGGPFTILKFYYKPPVTGGLCYAGGVPRARPMYIPDYDSYLVGDRRFPGKFTNLIATSNFPCYIQTRAEYIYWHNLYSIGGVFYFLGWEFLWGSAASVQADEQTILKSNLFQIKRPMTAEEEQEMDNYYAEEARHDAWLEMRAEQGWYDY